MKLMVFHTNLDHSLISHWDTAGTAGTLALQNTAAGKKMKGYTKMHCHFQSRAAF